ncbi:hypothetical protein C8Q78DRAFT_994067 [Trametes maxima]|nr:hypothetical protein C8Q78DRAFT_994067 [Trametes maxima]
MSSRSTRRYAAASTGGRPAEANIYASPKAIREQQAAEEAKAPATKSATSRRGRGGARGGRGRGRATTSTRSSRKEAVVEDSGAEDVSASDTEAHPVAKGKAKKEATPEESSGEESVIIPSGDEDSYRLDVELTPKIARRRSDASSPPATPKTPTPVKPNKGKMVKGKDQATPYKRAKESGSEPTSDEDISPAKKAKTEEEDKKGRPILPRRPYMLALMAKKLEEAEQAEKAAEAQAAAAEKKATARNYAEVVITPRRVSTPHKSSSKVASASTSKGGKAAKAPDSGSSFFTRETDDEDKARRQRQLFEKDLVSCLGSAGGSTMDKNKNQKGDNSDSSEGEVIPWADTEAEESDKDVNMDDLAEEISNKLDLDLDDPEVVDGVLRNTYQDLPSVCECEVVTADGSAISTVLYSQGFLKEHNVNPSALQKLVTFATDGAYVINPARQDPCSVVTTTFGQSINPVLSWAPRSGQMVRVICMSLGFVFTCNVVFPASFGKQGTQSVKSILFGPVRAEWERTVGFFGSAFKQDSLGVPTFTASQRYVGISIRTFPSEVAPALPDVSFIGATPTKRSGKKAGGSTSAKVPSVPSRSLLEMRDKTTWSTNDDVGAWDGTEYFKRNKKPSMKFSFDVLHTLPRLTADPNFGDTPEPLWHCPGVAQGLDAQAAEHKHQYDIP